MNGQWGQVPDRFSAAALSFISCLFVLAAAARGAEAPCVVGGLGSFAIADDGLDVVSAERSDLRPGDRLLQLNGRRLATCADLTVALDDAQRQSMLVVVALRRDNAVQTVLLTAPRETAPVVAAASPPPTAVAPPPAAPIAPVTKAAPAPTVRLLKENPAALAPMVKALRTFSDQIALPLTPQPYGRRFETLQQTYRDLRANSEAIAAVDPIMQYYQAVATFVSYRERVAVDRVTRDGASAPSEVARVRMPATVVEYTTESDVGELLRRYAFLDASIERKPGWMGQAEYAGLWKPDEAIRLLVERAREDIDALPNS